MALVPAYDARTGKKLPQLVPDHWFDHPVLKRGIRRAPKSAATARSQEPPAQSATQEEEK